MESIRRSQRYRFTPELPLLPAETCVPLVSLPPELLLIIIAEHLEDRTDIQTLSRTCHALHCLTSSPALEAAWLWRWHGEQALFQQRSLPSMPVLRRLVEVHHADVNALKADGDGLGFSLLHLACQLDRTEIVGFLISAPIINVNLACGDAEKMPLHVACFAGSVCAVRQLLDLPQIQVNAATTQGISGLHLACCMQKVEVVKELLRHTDVNVNLTSTETTWSPLSPMTIAAFNGNTEIMALLLRHPATNVNAAPGMAGGMSPLRLACREEHAEVVRQLLRHPDIQMNIAAGTPSLLGIACAKECLPVIRELLQHPGLEAGTIRAALAAAEARGQTAVVALLKGSRAVRRALRGQGGA